MDSRRYAHVLWDWNGTLLDDAAAGLTALNRMLSRRERPPLNLERYRAGFGFPVRNAYRAWGFDLATEDWDGLAGEYHAEYDRAAGAAPLRAGALESLSALRRAAVGMSVLSACEESRLLNMLSAHGIRDFFALVRGARNLHGESKLEAGRALIAGLGVPAGRVLLIGDTTHDYEVARALNCGCLLIEGGHHSTARLRECGCPVAAGLPLPVGTFAPRETGVSLS